MDVMLPDLLVHPSLEPLLPRIQDLVHGRFNLQRIEDLEIFADQRDSHVYYVTDEHIQRVCMTLHPHYYKYLKVISGSRPSCTSYWFDKPQPLYRVGRNFPRHVIWTYDDPLTVCATTVDRLPETTKTSKDWTVIEFERAVRRAMSQSQGSIVDQFSVIVFDLDKTLIDRDGKMYTCADELLLHARRVYDKVVLWSHGSPLHVDTYVSKFKVMLNDDTIFDLVLSHQDENEHEANKNMLHLYNHFPSCHFYRATLVDDSPYNWTPEYTSFIVPKYSRTAKKILPLL